MTCEIEKHIFCIFGFIMAVLTKFVESYNPDAVLCPLSEYIDDEDETVREYFECPGPEDPHDYTVRALMKGDLGSLYLLVQSSLWMTQP